MTLGFGKGPIAKNIDTGEILCLLPGYYVNPKQLGVITNIKNEEPK